MRKVQPPYFRCAKCRRTPTGGFVEHIFLTGREKRCKPRSARYGATSREYACTSCHHVGWSAHNDLARADVLEATITVPIGSAKRGDFLRVEGLSAKITTWRVLDAGRLGLEDVLSLTASRDPKALYRPLGAPSAPSSSPT